MAGKKTAAEMRRAAAEKLAKTTQPVGMAQEATATSRERSAAMDDYSHIARLKSDAAYQATQDKGTSRRDDRARAAAKDDYSHVRKLVKDAADDAKERRRAKKKIEMPYGKGKDV
jgi:hypothetical protein